ncbi:hypothetical protein AB0O95_10175 [Rhodoglobus sp. NPDC076762]
MKTTTSFKVSTINVVLLGLLLAGAVVAGLLGSWFGMALLLVAAAFIFVSAVYARGQEASDVLRLNAIEYRDERDRLLARNGFAVVGVAALSLAMAEFVLALVLQQFVLLAAAQVFVLNVIWGIANSVAAKRG